MADEKSAYALMNAVESNMDRLRQSINALRQLHDRWKDGHGDGTFINLIAQLTALKSNLGEMQDWMNYAITDLHPQLLNDMDFLTASCGLLVRNLDDLVRALRQDHDQVDWAIKLRHAVGRRTIRHLKNVAKRQTDAVQLLLAACKCHTTAQRKILVHKSRQIRKEDASSMAKLVRTSKWNGRCMRTLTKISRTIQWLRYVFYLRLLGKQRNEPPTEQEYIDAAAAMRSEAIDRSLEEDAASLRRETKLVLMGSPNSGKELIMRQMKVLYADGHHPTDERATYIPAIRSTVRLLSHSIINLLKDTGIPLPRNLSKDFAILLHEVETTPPHTLSAAASHALSNIWQSPQFSALFLENVEIDFPPYSPYFASSVHRLAAPDYLPSTQDIIRLPHTLPGIKELRFTWDDLPLHLFNISGFIPTQFRKRWFHQLENATALLYTVDVSTYDRPYLGQPTESQLLDDFATFESWANSPKFAGASVILLLNNFSRFRDKLKVSPLSSMFPDFVDEPSAPTPTPTPVSDTPMTSAPQPPARDPYHYHYHYHHHHQSISSSSSSADADDSTATADPDHDPDAYPPDPSTAARQFILGRFKAVNRNRLSIYSFWVDLDAGENQALYAALQKTLRHIQMRRAKSDLAGRQDLAAAGLGMGMGLVRSGSRAALMRGVGTLGSLRSLRSAAGSSAKA